MNKIRENRKRFVEMMILAFGIDNYVSFGEIATLRRAVLGKEALNSAYGLMHLYEAKVIETHPEYGMGDSRLIKLLERARTYHG